MSSSLQIWCNQSLTAAAKQKLIDGVRGHSLLFASDSGTNLTAGGPDSTLATADVAFGQPDPEQVISLEGLRWVQLTSAGYTRYDRDDVRDAIKSRGATMTNASSVFDRPCAEHLLAFMLAQTRQLSQCFTAQARGEGWKYDAYRERTRLLEGQRVLILGFGAIARRLVDLLAPFDVQIYAVRQTLRGDEPVPVQTIEQLDSLLPDADHVVNILPANASTGQLVDAKKFAKMKSGATFYNIGRGSTVNQEALLKALQTGQLAAAYLDVTDPEPLPTDHPLWSTPNCFITPHIGGGHGDESLSLVDHFLANLKRFDAELPLTDRII